MKRNCNNCKALTEDFSGVGKHCELGYKTKCIKEIYGVPVSYKPLEECEKPITFAELDNCRGAKNERI